MATLETVGPGVHPASRGGLTLETDGRRSVAGFEALRLARAYSDSPAASRASSRVR